MLCTEEQFQSVLNTAVASNKMDQKYGSAALDRLIWEQNNLASGSASSAPADGIGDVAAWSDHDVSAWLIEQGLDLHVPAFAAWLVNGHRLLRAQGILLFSHD